MRSVYVVGPAGAGKTSICVALALELRDQGLRVAFFKPVGYGGEGREDDDGVLFQQLLGLNTPLNDIVPFKSSPMYLWRYEESSGYIERVREAFAQVTREADVAVIEGALSPYHMASLGLDIVSMNHLLDPLVLTVQRAINDLSIDLTLHYHDYFRAFQLNSAGVILNQVPRTLQDKASGLYSRVLADKGVKVLGIIPERLEIALPRVLEFSQLLEAEVLSSEDRLSNPVEDIVVGAMGLESAIRYFRRGQNKAVITGGDRADLALAALQTSTSVIILTGGLYPHVRVIAKAEEKGVPVLLTSRDTLAVVELVRSIARKIRPSDEHTLEIIRENFREHCDHQRLLELITH